MIRDGKVINHSGEGAFWGNAIAWTPLFIAFLGCLFAMGQWSLEAVFIPGLIAMGLATLTFLVPKQVLGRSDSVDITQVHREQSLPVSSEH